MKFPCKNCIVKLQCADYCDRVPEKGLYQYITLFEHCPDCGHDKFQRVYPIYDAVEIFAFKCLDCNKVFHLKFIKVMGKLEYAPIIIRLRYSHLNNEIGPDIDGKNVAYELLHKRREG